MTFEWPILLWSLALIPIMVGGYILAQRRRRMYTLRFTNLELLQAVAGRGPGLRRHIPPLLFLLGLAALLVSLARPSAVIAVPRDQTTAMLVLDVSASMTAADLRPNRMEAAKQAARAFLDALPPNMQVGLVSFSSGATVNAAPTNDRFAVARAIDALQANGGTAIGEGLHLALDQLAQRPVDEDGSRAPGLVVLLSDGQSILGRPPETAAARARQEQIKIHTIGIGERGADTVIGGQRVRLDEQTLQAVAAATEGRYFYAGESNELTEIYANLGSQISWVEEQTEITALVSALGALCLTAGGLLSLRWLQQLP